MTLALAILLLIGMWLSVAAAMLWGVLRIARRHHGHYQPKAKVVEQNTRKHAHAH
ncbi:hypothetical protein [Pseudomonas fontis]|uniref:Uncharacterized protein n=1 Tax=Pseudomonas fontis TaxID=2942633 RepID=A0ABT5NU99_9PSED|nr:hypothetical protein [Pseudomonas fontis]MDD0973912.1 hypothetical protein [Pseudomonas fontis]MDD0991754.1 hypothetical protein [Pseudomonas fontis]